MAAQAGSLDELGRKPLHPAIDGDMVYRDAALGQQLLDIAIGQAIGRYQRTAITSRGNRKPANTEVTPRVVTEPVSGPPRSDNATEPKRSTYFPCGLNWARIGGVPVAEISDYRGNNGGYS